MSPRRIVRFAESNAHAIAYLILAAASIVALGGILVEAKHRTDAVARESIARTEAVEEAGQQICHSIESQNDALSDLIEVVIAPPAEIPPSLSDLPEFAALDQRTQDFVRALERRQTSQEDLAERLIEFQRTRLTILPEFCLD